MPIEDTNKYLADVFGYSQRQAERIAAGLEKAVARRLKQSLKEVQQKLANMYASMGDQVTFADMQKYNRLTNIEYEIADELKRMGIETNKLIGNGTEDIFSETYYNGGYGLENGIGVKLGFGQINTDAIKAALVNPYDKIGWKTRSLEHVAALTVKIRGAVTEGLVQGYGYNKTAKIFAEKFANTTNSLIKIVQTETHRATELANLTSTDKAKAAAERLGLILKREWRATLDGKTRDQHARLDGQIEDEEGYFQIDGRKGTAPGNFGIAEMDINCRCTTVTQLDGETPAKRWDNVEKKRIPYQTYEEWAKGKNIPMKYKKGGMPKAPKAIDMNSVRGLSEKYSIDKITAKWTVGKNKNIEIASDTLRASGYRSEKISIKNKSVIARWNRDTKAVEINETCDWWENPVASAQDAYGRKWLSSDNPLQPVLHEIGHSLIKAPRHWEVGMGYKKIANKVGKYAGWNPDEFIVETFAGLMTGKKYSDDIMDLFYKYSKLRP